MGLLARLRVLIIVTVTVSVVGLVYARVGKPLLDLAGPDGRHSGFLSDTVVTLDQVVPALLAAILLATVLWFLASPVREERARRRRP